MTAKGNEREILCFVWIPGMMLTWVMLPNPDPRTSVDAMRKRAAEGRRVQQEVMRAMERQGSSIFRIAEAINEELSIPKAERIAGTTLPWWKQFAPSTDWHWYGSREIIPECLGAPEPQWDERSVSWWQDHEHHLTWVQSAADVARIAVPDWPNTAPVAKMLAAYERWNHAFPEQPAAVGGARNYTAFVDLGLHLMGSRFFTILGSDPEFADALMDKCLELSASYDAFMRSLRPAAAEVPAQLGFGGDASSLLSPRLYEKYGIGFDVRLFEHFQITRGIPPDWPCNMHSCGPSLHLYDAWGRHPYRKNITTMQTRFLPGQVKKLRSCLQDTLLELTLHPQQFDFAGVEPAEIRQVVWDSARAAGFRDLQLTILVAANQPADIPRIEANLRVCYQAVTEINQQLEAGSLP